MRIAVWIATAAVVIALLVLAMWPTDRVSAPGDLPIGPRPGAFAPDFTLPLADNTGSITLSDLRGESVILNFWATWCGPCLTELPELATFARLHRDRAALVLVNTERNEDAVRRFLADNDYTLPVVFDRDGKIGDAYEVRAIPLTLVIDPDGVVVWRYKGVASRAMLLEVIDRIDATP